MTAILNGMNGKVSSILHNAEALSVDDLTTLMDGVQELIQQKLESEHAALLEAQRELKELAKRTGVPLRSRPIKYAHPDDPSLVWAGTGSRPKWVQELLDKGMTLEELRA